jgi:hypothetical protein
VFAQTTGTLVGHVTDLAYDIVVGFIIVTFSVDVRVCVYGVGDVCAHPDRA